ncbi:alpha/beta hydrolase [Embleya sp. NPDC050154]|uniref:alpha/beta hydrolase n=1 Tax=unclassified Embleya TaxID=2699296 RepID=UPI0037AD8432
MYDPSEQSTSGEVVREIDPDLDHAYDARGTVGVEGFARLMARYRAESDLAVDGLIGTAGVRYDPESAEVLDVWGAAAGGAPRPVLLFVHGGYWRALSRLDSAFMARMLDAQGIATVVVDYTLAPEATLEEIVRQVRAAVAWIHHHGGEYGLDPARLVVAGSSAGGHLAATTLVEGWQAGYDLPADAIKGAVLFSGLYDLRPLLATAANGWLHLDESRAEALSPALLPLRTDLPVTVIAAEGEAAGFHTQTRDFRERITPGAEPVVIPDRNHFDVILDLADPESTVSRALVDVFRRVDPRRA